MTKENPNQGHNEADFAREALLTRELKRQAELYADAGFNVVLGMTREEYLSSLPTTDAVDSKEVFMSSPILVDGRIPWGVQADIASLRNYIDDASVKNWPDPKGHNTPDLPYIAWMKIDRLNSGKSAKEIRDKLSHDERGATLYEGVALLITKPEVINDQSILLPGSVVSEENVPVLHRWEDNTVGIGYEKALHGEPSFNPAVCVRTS